VSDTEADTYSKFVVPRWQGAAWENEPHSLTEQRTITDGYIITPHRVTCVATEWDAAGRHPSLDDLDRYGQPVPDDEYHTKDFERAVALRASTEFDARHLHFTQFLKKRRQPLRKPLSFASIKSTPATALRAQLDSTR
jgi:hypothetical protein